MNVESNLQIEIREKMREAINGAGGLVHSLISAATS
jgi:hypothetical protein